MTARILIVEDDPELQELYRYMLVGEAYEVVSARSGGEALEMLRLTTPDVIVLDLLLGDMSGHVFFRTIKEDPQYAAFPVILATVLPAETCRDLVALSPGTQVLRKPFAKQAFVGALAQSLAQSPGDGA